MERTDMDRRRAQPTAAPQSPSPFASGHRAFAIALPREASQSSGMAVFMGLMGYAGTLVLGVAGLGVMLAFMH